MKRLSDLEASAIGDVLKFQPCTAHFIRTCFRQSPAKRFSGSAGSVYPMMKRLEKRELISSEIRTEGQRDVKYFTVTHTGKAALRAWLGPPIDEVATLTVDPLRTRMLYLKWLTKLQRNRWFEQVEKVLRQKLNQVTAQQNQHSAEHDDYEFLVLADKNAIMELKTRLQWLAQAKKRLTKSGLL